MFKNVASKMCVYVFDSVTNLPVTGAAGTLTAYVDKDWAGVVVLGDTSATEIDSTNAKGYYLFDLTQAETNADALLFTGKSSTAGLVVLAMPALVFTTPPNFTALGITSGGIAKADLQSILTTALTETVAGYLAAAFKKLFDVTTPVFTAASVNQTGDSFLKVTQMVFTVANQLDVNVLSSAGVTIYNSDGTLAAVTAGTDVTFPALDSAGVTIPDDARFEYCVFLLNGGTGQGQLLLTTTKVAASVRKFNFLAAATPATISTDTTYVLLGSWRSNAALLNGSATAAAALGASYAALETGTAQAGSGIGGTTITLRSAALAVDNAYKNQAIFILTGAGAGQTNRIMSYTGSSRVAVVETPWVSAVDNTSTYIVLGRVE